MARRRGGEPGIDRRDAVQLPPSPVWKWMGSSTMGDRFLEF
jgi:hypothetical protein